MSQQAIQFSKAERESIQFKSNLTDAETDIFLGACERYCLNPLANQIYAQVRVDKRSGKRNMMIQTGIDGYRLLADRTGGYAGNDDPVFDSEESPTVARVTVYKIVGGIRCGFSATARWDAYFPGDTLGFMWKKMPHLMLGKCAEALALRKAFPAELSGIYTTEEMAQADSSPQISTPPASQAPSATVLSTVDRKVSTVDKLKAEQVPTPVGISAEAIRAGGVEETIGEARASVIQTRLLAASKNPQGLLIAIGKAGITTSSGISGLPISVLPRVMAWVDKNTATTSSEIDTENQQAQENSENVQEVTPQESRLDSIKKRSRK